MDFCRASTRRGHIGPWPGDTEFRADGQPSTNLTQKIDDFSELLMGYNGSTHEPKFFKLVWGTLLFKATEDLEATLKIEGSKDRETGAAFSGQPMQIVNCPPPPPITPNFAGPGCAQYLSVAGLPTGFDNNRSGDDPGQGNDLSTFEDVLTINYRRWGHTFTSVSGFYNYHFDLQFGNDGTPLTLLTTEAPEKYHQFSQEFRVASAAGQAIEYPCCAASRRIAAPNCSSTRMPAFSLGTPA